MNTIQTSNCNPREESVAVAFAKALLMDQLFRLGMFLTMIVALMSTGAYSQSIQEAQRPAPAPAADPTAGTGDLSATAGPTVYVTDASGRLATITLGTYAVHILGSEGAMLTDIAFNPKDGQLYGVSFTALYRLNRKTGKATFIGNLGINDANALVFNGQGVAYTEGVNSAELYTINTANGHVTAVGATKPFKSAGDLTFYNSGLVLSGYSGSSLTTTTPDTLVLVDPKDGKVLAYSELKIANLFGIVCTAKDTLFGFAGASVYQLFPDQTNIDKRAVLLKNLSGKGLAQIYGAAYDGYFLY